MAQGLSTDLRLTIVSLAIRFRLSTDPSSVRSLGHLVTGPNKQPHGQEWRSNVLELAHDGYGVVPEMPKDVTTHAFDEAVIASLDGYLRKRAG